MCDEARKGFDTCPRSRLRKMEVEAREKHNLDVLMGSEIEFYLCEWANGDPTPLPGGLLSPFTTLGFRQPCLAILEEAVHVLEKAGIEVFQFHAEGVGVGIFEISLEPLSPVKAIDALVYTNETLKAIAAKHKLHATMHPKPFEKASSLGAHMHISISDSGPADSFLAGMLKHLPAIIAFGMPNFDSYERQLIAGGDFVTWGDENRLGPIRRITPTHWEIRCLDACANMYLAMAAVICAGLGGVERMDELAIKGREKMALTVSEEELRELKVTMRMPTSLKLALESLKQDEGFKEALGTKLVERYLGNKSQELANSAGMSSLERRRTFVRVF
jgi:glutamine synthetase